MWQAAGAPASSLRASITISPDTMALVVAMAWIMLPAMPWQSREGVGRGVGAAGVGRHAGVVVVAMAWVMWPSVPCREGRMGGGAE